MTKEEVLQKCKVEGTTIKLPAEQLDLTCQSYKVEATKPPNATEVAEVLAMSVVHIVVDLSLY